MWLVVVAGIIAVLARNPRIVSNFFEGASKLVGTALANHSWGGFHWARTSNPFTLKVGDNVSSQWDVYLDEAISDWSKSNVLDLTKVTGGTRPRNCRPTTGQIEACNAKYGNTGWLGVAQIWISGSHITQATTKVNDTYFDTPTYNTPAWRRLVMCQEVGHTYGLDHQDEDFNNPNLGTCMDYTNDWSTNQHPNQHDYDQLAAIYAHTDSTTTVRSTRSTGSIRRTASGTGMANPAGRTTTKRSPESSSIKGSLRRSASASWLFDVSQ